MSNWLRGGLLAAVMLATPAAAGSMQDFEKQLTAAYAHYRVVLFQTNQNKKDETLAALAAFERSWGQILVWKPTPPPQYAEDTKWSETLEKVVLILRNARSEAERNELGKSHETLEAIRDVIGDLRLRNGIISFSDRMNAYHEQMEKILAGKYEDEAGVSKLREDVAVLAFLTDELERHKPVAFATDQAFVQGLAAVKGTVAALQAAARSGDGAKIAESRKALRQPYSRLFLKYG